MEVSDILYFGCLGQSGHYLFQPEVDPSRHTRTIHDGDCARFHLSHALYRALDTAFCPPVGTLGRYMVSCVPPWVIVSWWDNSVDRRPGSHSTFLFRTPFESLEVTIPEIINTESALIRASKVFPEVFTRQDWPKPL
jgi:hypothetical protein